MDDVEDVLTVSDRQVEEVPRAGAGRRVTLGVPVEQEPKYRRVRGRDRRLALAVDAPGPSEMRLAVLQTPDTASGPGAAAVSQMLGQEVALDVPWARALPLADAVDARGRSNKIVSDVLTVLEGASPSRASAYEPLELTGTGNRRSTRANPSEEERPGGDGRLFKFLAATGDYRIRMTGTKSITAKDPM